MRKRRIDSSIVAIGKNENEQLAIRQALELLPLEGVINSDDIIVITVNLVNMNAPEKAVVIGPESLREIIRFFKEHKPKRIVIAGGSGSSQTEDILNRFGHREVINGEGVEFVDLNKGPFVDIALGGNIVKETPINALINEATFMVSFTQLKNHEEATMSAALKNIALSWPPAEIHGYPKKNLGIHEDLHDFIAVMANQIPIDLSIVSMIPAMVGTGPTNGIPIRANAVLAATDPVACDTVGAKLLGFKTQGVGYLYRCSKMGIGEGNLDNITIKGDDINELHKEFSSKVYGQPISMNE